MSVMLLGLFTNTGLGEPCRLVPTLCLPAPTRGHGILPQHCRPEMVLEVVHCAWSCSPRHPGQGALGGHYRVLSQWASYLSAFQQYGRFFPLQKTA